MYRARGRRIACFPFAGGRCPPAPSTVQCVRNPQRSTDIWHLKNLFRDLGRWKVTGEVVLALLLALLSAGLENIGGGSWPLATALALSVTVAALTPLRRVLPSVVLIIAAGLAGHFALPLLSVAAWSATRRVESTRRVCVTFAASILCFALSSTTLRDGALSVGLSVAAASLTFLLFGGLPALVGRLQIQRRRLLEALRERNEQLLRERALVAEQSRIRERQRIARDMHDSVGHQLTLIAIHAGALELNHSAADARTAIGIMREAATTAMQELQTVVGILSDPEAPGIEQSGPRGIGDIGGLVAMPAAGTQVLFEESGEPRPLSAAADACAYRLVQEGLTNAHKHAPGASILVELRWEPDAVVVAVANEPPRPGEKGTEPVSGGNGLTGLRERARLASGMSHSGASADGGFRVAVVLPYTSDGRGAEATLVAAADDFGEQSASHRLGDVGVDSTHAGTDRKLGREMRKKTAKHVAWGCGGSLIVVAAITAVGFFGILKLSQDTDRGSISKSTYDAVVIGQDEKSVRGKLPSGSTFLLKGLGGKVPADPPGGTCVHYLSQPVLAAHKKVYRFCFMRGKLVDKSVLTSRP